MENAMNLLPTQLEPTVRSAHDMLDHFSNALAVLQALRCTPTGRKREDTTVD